VQIHTDALAIGFHTERDGAIEKPEKQVNQRQNQPEQRGDPDKLREKLSRPTGEKTGSGESP
jgi:hypothetical protein